MVEFGLKLEDNKVDEWSEYYIEYEKLKLILKKCKAALMRYNDLAQKKPDEAARIKASFQSGMPTPLPSKSDLIKLSGSHPELNSIHEHMETERSELVSERSDYGSTNETSSDLKHSESTGSLLSRVTDYFSKSYERQVREVLKDLGRHSQDFETLLQDNIETVNRFYNSKLEELRERLEFLKENVAQSRGVKVIARGDSDISVEQVPEDVLQIVHWDGQAA